MAKGIAHEQIRGKRRVSIMIKMRPIERDTRLSARRKNERNPRCEELLRIDRDVRKQPIHLLDAVLRIGPLRERKRASDGRDAERSRMNHPRRRLREREDPLRVKVRADRLVNEIKHIPRMHPNAPFVSVHGASGRRLLHRAS